MTAFDSSRSNAGITISNGGPSSGLTATLTGAGNVNGVPTYCNSYQSSGKLVLSFKWTSINGAANEVVGFVDSSASTAAGQYPGIAGSHGVGWSGNTGDVFINDTIIGTGQTFGVNNVLYMAIDFSALKIWVKVDSGFWDNDSGGTTNPDNGTGGFSLSTLSSTTITPGAAPVTTNDVITLNPAEGGSGLTSFLPWDLLMGQIWL